MQAPSVSQADLVFLIGHGVLESLQDRLRTFCAQQFWVKLQSAYSSQGRHFEESLCTGLKDVCDIVEQDMQTLRGVETQLSSSGYVCSPHLQATSLLGLYQRGLGASVLTSAPISLEELLEKFFSHKLAEYSEQYELDEGASLSSQVNREWVDSLHYVTESMRFVGLEDVCETAYSRVVCQFVQQYVEKLVADSSASQVLQQACTFVQAAPLRFLRLVLQRPGQEEPALEAWRARLEYFIFERVGQLRMGQLFDLVIDYPDSLPAIEDLRDCFLRTNLNPSFIASFRTAIHERLLHAGASTSDIIYQYVATMKTLREIDTRGLLMSAVGEPIKEYLRGRPDTIRCIVTMITDDSGGEAGGESLFSELGTVPFNQEEDLGSSDEGDKMALEAAQAWQPDQAGGHPSYPAQAHASRDIIAVLVSIYGSKELFIHEYRSMLAEKLLAKTDYDTDREIHMLELLKLRFGESNLHNCEVMLRDVAESKRINANIKNLPRSVISPVRGRRVDPADISSLSASMISALFWPTLPEVSMRVHPEVQVMLDTYAAKYHSLKAPRKLVWRHHLGSVKLEVAVRGEKQTQFTVSPLQATIVMHFQDKPEWRVSELAREMKEDAASLRRRALFWVHAGVLEEVPCGAGDDVLLRVCTSGPVPGQGARMMHAASMDDEPLAAVTSSEGHMQQEMARYESYIMGMLTNFDGLPLERIHNMLKMFVVEPAYDKSAEQLGTFLAALVAQEKIAQDAGVYRKIG